MIDEAFGLGKSLVKDFLFDIICYSIGWFVLRILTLNNHPDETLVEGIRDGDNNIVASLLGMAVLLFLALQIGIQIY